MLYYISLKQLFLRKNFTKIHKIINGFITVQVQTHIRLNLVFFRTLNKKKESSMTVYNEWTLNLSYLPQNLTEEACYRYNILIRYKRLRENGFSENEALEFLQVKHSYGALPKIRPFLNRLYKFLV